MFTFVFERRLNLDRENILNKGDSIESQNSIESVTKRILKTDGNGFKLSLLTLAFLMIVFAFLVLFTLPPILFGVDSAEEISVAVALVCTLCDLAILAGFVLLAVPIASGIMYFASYTVCGLRPYLLHVATPFEKGLYFRSIAIQTIIFVRMLIVGLPFVGGLAYLPIFFTDYTESSFFFILTDSAFVICSTIAATLVGAYFSSFLFFAPYLIISQNKGVFSAISESFRISKGRRLKIMTMTARGLFDLILSALSFMVLFVIYAMPRMTISYFVYCNSVIENDGTTI